MFFSLSNTTSPSMAIRPLSGFSIPAMHFSVRLFPQPELPKSATTSFLPSSCTDNLKSGKDFSISEDESVRQFEILLDAMEKAGYEHYEISNFARAGFRSRHNSAYWRQQPYIGIGPAAHSYDGQSRQWNISNNSEYIASLTSCPSSKERGDSLPLGEGWGGACWFEREQLTPVEQYNEYILLSLRTAWGVDIEYVHRRFGNVFAETFLQKANIYIQNGAMQEQTGVFSLTRKGKIIADRIASDLFLS